MVHEPDDASDCLLDTELRLGLRGGFARMHPLCGKQFVCVAKELLGRSVGHFGQGILPLALPGDLLPDPLQGYPAGCQRLPESVLAFAKEGIDGTLNDNRFLEKLSHAGRNGCPVRKIEMIQSRRHVRNIEQPRFCELPPLLHAFQVPSLHDLRNVLVVNKLLV